MYIHTEHAFMLNAKQKRGKERDEKELSGRARCAEGKRMNEWADGRDGGVSGGERNEQRENKREQRDLERKRRAVLTVTDASVLDCHSNTNHNLADAAERLHTAEKLHLASPSLQDSH